MNTLNGMAKLFGFCLLSLSVCLLMLTTSSYGDKLDPLMVPTESKKSQKGLLPLDKEKLLSDIKVLKGKSNLLRKVAEKKYNESNRLRAEAGSTRGQASARAQALQSQANSSAQTSQFLGSMLSTLAGMTGALPDVDPTSGQLLNMMSSGLAQQDANKSAAELQAAGQAGSQLLTEAERHTGPLEMKAAQLEDEGNRLIAAANKFEDLANSKMILVAAEELRLKAIDGFVGLEELTARVSHLIAKVNTL